MILEDKENNLKDILNKYKSCAVAFSGGTDSTLLLYYLSMLNIKTKAYTFHSYLYPEKELEEAKSITSLLNIPHEIIYLEPLKEIENIKNNPKDRCYICKSYMFSILREKSTYDGYETIVEGSNYDDRKDFRPGFVAVQENGAVSPLDMAQLSKNDIRELLKKADFNYLKPSFACYFSRFPYNTEISVDMIKKVSECENYIHSLGFISARFRYHDKIARIELSIDDMKEIINNDNIRQNIIIFLKSYGFVFICIDLEEYKTGSMNKLL